MSALKFRKSSYSNQEHECIEVATDLPTTVAVRDSKDSDGPILRFTPAAWAAFASSTAQGILG